MLHARQSRRSFFVASGIAAFAVATSRAGANGIVGANDRLNIGVIGVGGRGAANLDAVSSENIVALCDVDSDRLGAAAARFPSAKSYVDYRQLLEQSDLDAVVVATPDHHHAPATVFALRRGLHVYCEKPLTHTVEEARLIAKLASESKLATQMGTQNHEHPGYLRLVELLQSNAVGQIREVHVITDRPGQWWPQGMQRPTDTPSTPTSLNWDLWLGPASERPYHPAYAPFRWRGWWDFGCGAIGDMAIHLADPAFWGLNLGGSSVRVTSTGSEPNPYSGPTSMVTHMEFPARGDRGPVTLIWYEGQATPNADIAKDLPMNGSLFIGDLGKIAIQHDGFPRLLPEDQFKDFKPPSPTLPDSPGHHLQWIQACKTGSGTGSPFSYAAPFTETILLGNVAFRSGRTIEYDSSTGKITNEPSASQFLSKEYRKGWEVR
ncbi:MAG: Gfo/Idh/MocA family oxidoreductase [Planctomyces sp.]|nr:Gfo/Idh/MocA family oxidoreductase [Planctomyces sp.]